MRDVKRLSACAVTLALPAALLLLTATACRPDERNAVARTYTIFGGGDSLLTRRLHKEAQTPVNIVLGRVLPLVRRADIAFLNLEGLLSDRGTCSKFHPAAAPFCFRGRPKLVRLLSEAGIDVVSQANNHTGDFGPSALDDSLQILASQGIVAVGAGANAEEARRIRYVVRGGVVVAWIAFQEVARRFAARGNRTGNFFIEKEKVSETLVPLIRQAREVADLVVISAHWGNALEKVPSELRRQHARKMIDAGADLILGHSAHHFQGAEVYRNGLVLYDTGNFILDFSGDGLVFEIAFDASGVSRLTAYATRTIRTRIDLLQNARGDRVLSSFIAQSRALNPNLVYRMERHTAVFDLEPGRRSPPPRRYVAPKPERVAFDFSRKPACVVSKLPGNLTDRRELAFGNGVRYLGAVVPATVPQKGPFLLRLYFSSAGGKGTSPWLVSTRLRPRAEAAKGVPAATHVPTGWIYPVGEWAAGEIVEDAPLLLTGELPKGTYDLLFGLIDETTGTPEVVKGDDGGAAEQLIGSLELI